MEVDQRKKMEKKRRNERSENNWGKGERDISERREGKREGRWKEGRERKSKSGGGRERDRQRMKKKKKKGKGEPERRGKKKLKRRFRQERAWQGVCVYF